MSDSIEIIPTVVPKDAGAYADAIEIVRVFASAIHLDISDGVFTEAVSWPYSAPGEFGSNFSLNSFPTEAHLMVKEPHEIGDLLSRSGMFRLVAQIEAFTDAELARTTVESWRSNGAEVGVSLLIDTPIERIAEVAELCDVIQVMSVASIGAQGAAFDRRAVARVDELHRRYPRALISVDGGVAEANIGELARIGARRFAIGSAIMKTNDPVYAYNSLKSIAERAIQ